MTKRLSRAGFDIDLKDGEAREDALARLLRYGTVEHKRDYKCAVTGNVAIEVKQHGRLSGIATSTADWWAIEYAEDCRIILPRRKLVALVRQAITEKRYKMGGDYNQFLNVLVPIEWLVRPIKLANNKGY